MKLTVFLRKAKMKAVVSGAIAIIIAIVIGLFILAGVIGSAQGAKGAELPGTGLFDVIERVFGFLEMKTYTGSQETKKSVCDIDEKTLPEACKITIEDLDVYCNADEAEKIKLCEPASENMKGFCSLNEEKKKEWCRSPEQYKEACKQRTSSKDFCK